MALNPKGDDDGGGTVIIIINQGKAALKKFKAENPITFGAICGFLAGAFLVWVL